MPFESEAERLAEALRRELEQEREAHEATRKERARVEAELQGARRELDRRDAELERRDAELERWKPRVQLPLGWFPLPVLGAIALVLLTVALGVGAITSAARNETRLQRVRKERDDLAAAAARETKSRRAVREAATELPCLTACGCPPGQGCSGEVCREGVSPAYCCEGAPCPAGAPCERFDGTDDTCPDRAPRERSPARRGPQNIP